MAMIIQRVTERMNPRGVLTHQEVEVSQSITKMAVLGSRMSLLVRSM